MPYSGEGRLFRLAQYSNVNIPGRWIYRVDEQIITGGCSNESIGWMYTAPIGAMMLGGVTVNVSGPCFRPGDVVKAIFDEYSVDCIKVRKSRPRSCNVALSASSLVAAEHDSGTVRLGMLYEYHLK